MIITVALYHYSQISTRRTQHAIQDLAPVMPRQPVVGAPEDLNQHKSEFLCAE